MAEKLERGDKESDFLFKDAYFEDLEFSYEPSILLGRQLSDRCQTEGEFGGKRNTELSSGMWV